jgi:hypothetical protein
MSDPSKADAFPPARVLTLGDNQSFFVAILCREMKRSWPRLEFDICDYIKYGDNVSYDESTTFRAQHKSPSTFAFRFGMVRAVAGALLSSHFYRRVGRTVACFGLAERSVIDATARSLGKAVQIERFRNEVLRGQFYDIWHFHFITPSSVRYIDIVPAKTKVICSFWGSDLLRSHGAEAYVPVFNALERADAITTQSVEMREFILCKFGRHLRPKIHCCRFPADTGVYQKIAVLCRDSDGRAQAKKQLGLPKDHTIIGIGHNGGPGDKHLEILRELERLPANVKAKIFLVFPMTYGLTPDYEKAVDTACQRSGFNYLILKDFLSRDGLAALRIAADMAIYMPESDAMSAAALETIYAGNVLVAGAWLPYGLYRRLGLPFVEVENYGQLPDIIPSIMNRPRPSGAGLDEMQKKIEANFCAEGTTPAWIDVYRSLVQPRPNS